MDAGLIKYNKQCNVLYELSIKKYIFNVCHEFQTCIWNILFVNVFMELVFKDIWVKNETSQKTIWFVTTT